MNLFCEFKSHNLSGDLLGDHTTLIHQHHLCPLKVKRLPLQRVKRKFVSIFAMINIICYPAGIRSKMFFTLGLGTSNFNENWENKNSYFTTNFELSRKEMVHLKVCFLIFCNIYEEQQI